MMKKIVIAVIAALTAALLFSVTAYAAKPENGLELIELSELEKAVSDSDNPAVSRLSIASLIESAMSGGLDLSPQGIINGFLEGLFGELRDILSLMRNMILIAIVSAMFKTLSSSMKQKGVSEMGFFVSYILITVILISSFNICAGVAIDMIRELCAIMLAAVPAMVSLLYISGKLTSAYVLNPILLFIANFIASFARDYIVVIISAAAGLELMNFISDRDILSKLAGLMKKGTGWLMKSLALLFMAIISLQSISAPAINNGVTKSAKAVINVVPVVGAALTGAVDSVSAWMGVVRGGTLAALIIVIVLLCFPPLVKLLAFIVILKLTAGLIQPIADARIVKAIDCVGGYVSLLLGAGVLTAVVFMFAAMVTLSLA